MSSSSADARSTSPRRASPRRGAGMLGAAAVATDAAEDVVLHTVRDVHTAVSDRVHGAANRGTGGLAALPEAVHRRVAAGVYGGLGVGLRTAATALRAGDRRGGARLEDSARGRLFVSALNGLIGDRLARADRELAIDMAVRRDGRDVACTREALAAAFPTAGGDLVVFVHGLGENEHSWDRPPAGDGDGSRAAYADRLAARTSWTPVRLRVNTGLPVAENSVALAGLLDELVRGWPTPVRRIALVGHSMGGLIVRGACAVRTDTEPESRWSRRVTDVVTLGTPHLGAPLERGVHLGARALGLFPESAPFGRILEYRSAGITDLRDGLGSQPRDVANLPRARYRLVGATLSRNPADPAGEVLGDLLVRFGSATGRPRRGPAMFPDADVLHVPGADHFDLLNHPDVYAALETWLR